jgi:hypothetical protein
MKEEKAKKKKSKRLTLAVIIVLIFVIVFSGLFFYIWSYKNVYAIVMGTKIYYSQLYYEAVKQAEKVNFLGYDPLSSDPKVENARRMIMDYAEDRVLSERLYYLMGVKDGFSASDNEIETAFENYKNDITKGSTDPEKDFKDDLKARGLTEQGLRGILKNDIIASREKDKLTENINVSESDVREYFNDWGSGYGTNGKNNEQIYKEKYETIKQDAFYMKKSDYLDAYSKKLIADNAKYISMDNVYKRFMRWYYQAFLDLPVPDQYLVDNT